MPYTKQYINRLTVKFLEKPLRKHPYLVLKRGDKANLLGRGTGRVGGKWHFRPFSRPLKNRHFSTLFWPLPNMKNQEFDDFFLGLKPFWKGFKVLSNCNVRPYKDDHVESLRAMPYKLKLSSEVTNHEMCKQRCDEISHCCREHG